MHLWKVQDDSPVLRRVSQPVTLNADDSLPGSELAEHPRLIPSDAVRGTLGGLLVPQELARKVTRNGVPLAPGVHALRHADRLEYEGRAWWVAVGREVSAVPYDAVTHGEDVYCFITKARLQEGELIVVCPGPAGADCGAIYREAAWEMVQQSNARFRCPRCGFDPAAGDWQPTLPRRSNVAQLLELARRRRAGGAT